jgi:hypothetical protein
VSFSSSSFYLFIYFSSSSSSSSVESDLLTLAGFLKTRALHSGRQFLSVQQPPATAVPVLHTRRMAYTRQGSLSLDRRVWVTTCLLGCSWGVFLVVPRSSGEFLLQRTSPVAVRGLHSPSSATVPLNAGLDVGFCFKVFMFF